MTTVHTIGHGRLSVETFTEDLEDAGIHVLIDVRSFPGSRHNPQYGREAMEQWLPAHAIDYHWLSALGGRRRLVSDSKHVALRHPSFRAYADHMETSEFLAGVDELLGLAGAQPTAVMCSEAVWWRCHRRLLADHLHLVRGIQVRHLMPDRRVITHRPTDGVRMADAALTYDLSVPPQLPVPGVADPPESGGPNRSPSARPS